jgi:Domain of unknown function (DUF222)
MEESAIGLISSAIDALCDVDVDALSDAELHAIVVSLQRLGDRLTIVGAPLLERWRQRQVWASDGSKSAAARLSRECAIATASASRALHCASSLASMPATAAAGAAGELSLDQVNLLARANSDARRDLFARDEAMLLGQVCTVWFNDAARIVRYWEHRSDAELGRDHDAADQHAAEAYAHCSTTLDGMVAVDAELDPVGGAIYADELRRLTEQNRIADETVGVDRTPAQRRAAAMVEMARRSAAMPAGATPAKPLFVVHIGDGTLAHLCELANGTVITPAHLAPFLTDAMLEVVLFDGPTTVISVSRQRSFTGAVRRAIEARDRHCQHPAGCDVPADLCDVDHIIPVSAGGATAQHNGRLECPTHNRNADKHDHGAEPFPERTVTRTDEVFARLRWKARRGADNDDDEAALERHVAPMADLHELLRTA